MWLKSQKYPKLGVSSAWVIRKSWAFSADFFQRKQNTLQSIQSGFLNDSPEKCGGGTVIWEDIGNREPLYIYKDPPQEVEPITNSKFKSIVTNLLCQQPK